MNRWSIAVALVALSACKGKEAEKPGAVIPPPTPSATAATSTHAATSTKTPSDTTNYLATMLSRRGDERESRPDGTPTVEAVMAALTAGGLPTQPGRQVLGAIVKASYCWQTSTTDDALGLAICEYPSAEAAAAGKEVARATGAAFGDRTILVRGKTTLLMKGPADKIAKASAIFQKL